MNAERLLAHYARSADSPDATSKLRNFILDLAVRGKLVAQDIRDEPASELLKRIAKEKERLAKAGEIRAGKSLPPATKGSIPFDLPFGWVPARLGNLIHLVSGQHLQPPEYSEDPEAGLPYITGPSDFGPSGLQITRYALARKAVAKSGQLLLTVKGSGVGKTATCDIPEVAISRQLMALTAIKWDRRFLVLITHRLAESLQESARSLIPGIGREDVEEYVLALPPVAEQHRIVTKVDELMALCDRLEAARAEREVTRDRLTASTLARLNSPDPVTFQADARFALNILPALTTRPDQIKQLRQTILNLAVRGKLVPQDRNDEPASELLKQLAAGKTEKKQKTDDARIRFVSDPKPSDMPLELPPGWLVQSFENLFLFIDYRGNTPAKTTEGIPLITAKNVRMGYLNRDPREFISKSTFKTWMTRGFPSIGDLFFTTEAPLANVCINDVAEPFALAQRVICLQPYADINTKFLMLALMSDVMQSLIDAHATGMTAKGIKAAKLKPLPVPIPPLAEQHRIVTRVDALMTICDHLETCLDLTAVTRRRLLDALLADALAPAIVLQRDAAE